MFCFKFKLTINEGKFMGPIKQLPLVRGCTGGF